MEILIHPNDHLQSQFALSCPLLLNSEQQENPYSMVELFFHYSSPSGYRKKLSTWFKCALSEGVRYKDVPEVLFIHSNVIQLLNAGFLIANRPLEHHHDPKQARWLLAIGSDSEVQLLDSQQRERPLEFIRETLTVETITDMRFGLRAWLECAVTEKDSIADLDHEHVFDLHEKLQRIIEAFYLVSIKQRVN